MHLIVVLVVSISQLLLRPPLFWAHTTIRPHSYLQLTCLTFSIFHHCITRTGRVTTPTIQCNIAHDNNPQYQQHGNIKSHKYNFASKIMTTFVHITAVYEVC